MKPGIGAQRKMPNTKRWVIKLSRYGGSCIFPSLPIVYVQSPQCGPLPPCLQIHRAEHAEGTGVRKEKRGRLGKAFMCCVVTVCRACPAAFLNSCISPCTSLSPSASHTARPAFPWAQHSASSLRLPWAGSVLLMEPGLKEEQEVKKHGGEGVLLAFGNLGIFSWGLWYSRCPRDVHICNWQLREKARLSPLSCL